MHKKPSASIHHRLCVKDVPFTWFGCSRSHECVMWLRGHRALLGFTDLSAHLYPSFVRFYALISSLLELRVSLCGRSLRDSKVSVSSARFSHSLRSSFPSTVSSEHSNMSLSTQGIHGHERIGFLTRVQSFSACHRLHRWEKRKLTLCYVMQTHHCAKRMEGKENRTVCT